MRQAPVYSLREKQRQKSESIRIRGATRPLRPAGHTPGQTRFSFVLTCAGIAVPQITEAEGLRIISSVNSTPDGDILSTVPYDTAAEAIAVGDEFPDHEVFARIAEKWREIFREQAENPSSAIAIGGIAKYAVHSVDLYGPSHRLDELKLCPTFDVERIQDCPFSGSFKYVFARSDGVSPLMEESFEPTVLHSDLPVPDYNRIIEIATQHPDLDMLYIQGKIATLRLEHDMPERATFGDFRLANAVAGQVARRGSESMPKETRDEYYNNLYREIMSAFFGIDFPE